MRTFIRGEFRFLFNYLILLLLLAGSFCPSFRAIAAEEEEKLPLSAFKEEIAPGEGRAQVFVLPLKVEINQGLMIMFRRAFREIERQSPDLVIIEIDTPGGRLRETEEIITWMRSTDVPICAFVNYHAQSAGAIISFGADRIFMAPGSRIGSALPIIRGSGGVADLPEKVYEKLLSDTRAMVRSIASENKHWVELAVAMVDPEYEVKIDDHVVSEEGELLNLTAEEAVEVIPPREQPLLAEAIVKDVDGLLSYLDLENAEVVYFEPELAEDLARWIITIGPILFALGILGVYMELNSPGIGIPGLAGGICLLIYFVGHHIGGLAGIEDLALVVIGFLLLALELFVIPGFGVAGFLGIVSILVGMVMGLVPRLPAIPEDMPGINTPALVDYLPRISLHLSMVVVCSGVGIYLLSKILPKVPFYGKLVLQTTLNADEGWVSSDADNQKFEGQTGTALTVLRPAGTAEIGNDRLDVVTEGDMIPKDSPIRVIRVEGNRIVVEKATEE